VLSILISLKAYWTVTPMEAAYRGLADSLAALIWTKLNNLLTADKFRRVC